MRIARPTGKDGSNRGIQRTRTWNVNAPRRYVTALYSNPHFLHEVFGYWSFWVGIGLEKLYTAAGLYIRAMGKKKEGEDREKSLPPEILGQAMISHGGDYAPESAYGQALLRLGSGMERMSRLQEVPSPTHHPPTLSSSTRFFTNFVSCFWIPLVADDRKCWLGGVLGVRS